MIQRMQTLLQENSMGVLATSSRNIPHCSLMAYITADHGDRLIFATRKETRKYLSIQENPYVSFLVDTRLSHPEDRSAVQALTVSGMCHAIADPQEHSRFLALIAEKHPHLSGIVNDPETAVLEMRISSLQLMDGPVNQFVYHTESSGADGNSSH
jgi:nitroimidazol reductase NimA-like FMN-containing flavoprotein (pyridoxamine 5'-phosphate oxidase superfamily)